MAIYEPWTLATDTLLAAVGGGLAWRLHARLEAGAAAAHWWKRTLALAALSAFIGGSSHGFGPNLPPAAGHALWVATLWTLSLTGAAMSLSLVHECVAAARRRPWFAIIAIKLALFVLIAFLRPDFLVAIIDYGTALVAWLLAALICRRRWRGWMLGAIGLSVAAAVVQQARWGLAAAFNHNDLYHVIQAGALYLFYRAALALGAETTATPSAVAGRSAAPVRRQSETRAR